MSEINPKEDFKEYLARSRDQLEKALISAPISTEKYEITKYCRIMIGETVDSKRQVLLTPRHEIEIKWLHETNFKTPKSIRFLGVKNLTDDEEYDVYWTEDQVLEWISKNASKLITGPI